VVAATRAELPAPVRGLALGGATLLAELALAGESRGWLFALPPALLVFVAVTPGRLRLVIGLGIVAVAVIAAHGPVVALSEEFTTGPGLNALVDDASRAILMSSAVVALVATALALFDRELGRRGFSPSAPRYAGLVAGVLAVVIGVGGYWTVQGSPVEKLGDKWEEFKTGPQPGRTGRLTGSLGSNRYDFWTVAWDRFSDRPVRGIGVDNFQYAYLSEGNSGELPRYPHSFELGVLSGTGLIGALLLFGGLIAGIVAALRGVFRRSGLAAATAGAAVSMFAYWLLHASVDWFWEFPALAGAALAALGLAAGLGAPDDFPREPRARRRIALAATMLAGLVAAVTLAVPWMAERQVQRAGEDFRENRAAQAIDRLDQAASLDPLSPRADLVAGSIALRVGDYELAQERFMDAYEREPRNHYAVLELGLIAALSGDRERATTLLAEALRLSPRDEVTKRALQDIRRGREPDIAALNRRLLQEARGRASAG
jgi:hypothetical protein